MQTVNFHTDQDSGWNDVACTSKSVTHFGSNRTRRRLIWLMCTTLWPLSYAATGISLIRRESR